MDGEDIADLFAPVVPVSTRRMFGGHGVYAEGMIFAIEIEGRLYLKTDAENRPAYEARGMTPFTYEKKTGGQAVMAYFALPDDAYDDEDLLAELTRLGVQAARRAEAAKALKAAKPGRAVSKSSKTAKKPG
jgi:DNA transformation protein